MWLVERMMVATDSYKEGKKNIINTKSDNVYMITKMLK